VQVGLQIEGIDLCEIFSLVVKLVSICDMLALVSLFDLEMEQLDVKRIFFHGYLDEEISMEQPEGFVQYRKRIFFCKLKNSLYDLK
jgi:hypothetical protein